MCLHRVKKASCLKMMWVFNLHLLNLIFVVMPEDIISVKKKVNKTGYKYLVLFYYTKKKNCFDFFFFFLGIHHLKSKFEFSFYRDVKKKKKD